jgi:hypothetical protein
VRGVVLVILMIVAVLAIGFGLVYGVGQAAGGISIQRAIFYGVVLVLVVLGGLLYFGRRRQRAARAKRAEQMAERAGR